MQINTNSEMNSLSNQYATGGVFEEVSVDTLDFIKLDAEGEETRILEGGETLLKQHSPLIMFEIKHGEHINHDLIQKLESMDFQCYRLVSSYYSGTQSLNNLEMLKNMGFQSEEMKRRRSLIRQRFQIL